MAAMIPDLNPISIKNTGERRVYQALSELPDDYTICYSYKYYEQGMAEKQEILREIDFVLVHPQLGYAVIEVKQGIVMYRNRQWYEYKNKDYQLMSKDPLEQAQKAMFTILSRYKDKSQSKKFPLKIRYVVCFPEALQLEGVLPAELDLNSIWFFDDIEDTAHLQEKINALFEPLPLPDRSATQLLINKILAPSFKIYSRLEEEIDQFCLTSARILSEEQERILEETELDRRKIFLGSAGTGKTFLAAEKACRLAEQGKKVLLTCFNRNLCEYLRGNLPPSIQVQTIHDYFYNTAILKYADFDVPEDPLERQEFFSVTLPTMAYDVLADMNEEAGFDSIIIDEGQDFREDWFACIEAMLKPGGELYIFADPAQTIFCDDIEKIQGIEISRHRLTRNLRNTQAINEWMQAYLPGVRLRCLNNQGLPVVSIPCREEEQNRVLEKEIGRLVSQGVQLKRITILSPHVWHKSCMAGKSKIKEWPVVDTINEAGNQIRFCTIRSFKGLEADIVFLVDIRPSRACTEADIYVGGSRARYLLYILHDPDMGLKR